MLASHAWNVSTGQHAEGATTTKVFGGGANFVSAECVDIFLIEEGFAEVDVVGPCHVVDVWVGDTEKNGPGVTVTLCFLVRTRGNDKAEFVNNFVSGVVSEISFVKRIGATPLDVFYSM